MNLFELYAVLTLDNQEYKNSLSESESYAETMGQKIQSVLGKLVALDVFKKAGSALVDLTKTAVTNFGEYEQLVGGMETLFKDSSEKMVYYANNAYKTAQISANDYMDTVTSFSASLISSLGGDTAKATEYANNAVIDMADNANKMGTSMESIQNAYQGFAKQNYTMLDNLKLGYGGTKEEMQRLLEDAEKISGIKYDISSFADLTDAIHVIQTELGITGTSALEATTTIQGSFNMMQSAWTNLTTAMADPSQSVGNAVADLVESVQAFASNIIPVVNSALPSIATGLATLFDTMITEVPTALSNLLPTLLSSVQDLILKVVDRLPEMLQVLLSMLPSILQGIGQTIAEGVPMLIQSLTEIIPMLTETFASICQQLANSLPENLPIFIENVLTLVQEMATALAENAPIIVEAGVLLITALAEGLIQALPILIEQLPTIITTFANVINDNAPRILEAGVELIAMLVEGIISAIPTLIENIPQIFEAFVSVWSALNWVDLGRNAITFLRDGITGMLGAIGEAGANVTTVITDAIRSLPEKLANLGRDGIQGIIRGFEAMKANLINRAGNLMLLTVQKFSSFSLADVGRNLIQGLINGIASMAGTLINTVANLMRNVVNGAKNILGIHSPSKVFQQIGEFVVAGFNNGLDTLDPSSAVAGFNNVINSVESLQSGAISLESASNSGGITQIINVNREVSTADEMARAIRLESKYGLMRGVAFG